jgi:small-conductance mechanosensitive channel
MARFRIDDSRMRRMFDTHSHSWREVGLARQLSAKAVRRARLETVVLLVLIVGVVVAYELRERLFGVDLPVRVVAAVALVALGWAFARDVGRSLGPALFRRMDPAAAGTVGFLIRLVGMAIFALVALRIAGLENRGLVPAAAATAVILGLAAQQTLGNVFAASSCSAPARSSSATASGCRAATSRASSRARSARSACSTRSSPTGTT